MTSILLLTEAIYCNMLRCNYRRNEQLFLHLFYAFSEFIFIFKHFEKKDEPLSWCIFELTDSEKRG